jgi:hypothetical protein
MSHIKDYIAGAIRNEILELQKLLIRLEDNSHLGPKQEYDLGISTISSVEFRLKVLRNQLKMDHSKRW